MKLYLLLIGTLLLVLVSQAVEAQKVLLLQKPGKTKRFFYEQGDKISVRMGEPEFTVYGVITYIDDSVCTVNKDYTFQFSKVNEVIRTRHFLSGSWRKLYLAAVLYAGGSMINRGINGNEPLIDNTIPIVSGSFVVLGTTALLLRYKHCKMENGWKLKVLDYDIFNDKEKVKQ
jgi:hypothetical protein